MHAGQYSFSVVSSWLCFGTSWVSGGGWAGFRALSAGSQVFTPRWFPTDHQMHMMTLQSLGTGGWQFSEMVRGVQDIRFSEVCVWVWVSHLRNNPLILQRCSHSPKNGLAPSPRTLPGGGGGHLLMGRRMGVQNMYHCTEHIDGLRSFLWIQSESRSIKPSLREEGLINNHQFYQWPTGVFSWVFIRVKPLCQYSHFSMDSRYLFLPWVSSQASYMALYK